MIADDENLGTARELGFGTIHQTNEFLGRKFNDGFQLACDPALNPRPADYAVPFGTDDWIDYRILLELPRPDTIVGFQTLCTVSPDGKEMTARRLDNTGGTGLRIYPRQVIAQAGYRPADEDRNRGCDTSTMVNLRKSATFTVAHRYIDPRQIVDWKSERDQVNPYESVSWRKVKPKWEDPFSALAGLYPREAIEEMRTLY